MITEIDEADAFVTAYEEIAAQADISLAAIKRKLSAPVRRIRYQDLENTIWTVWGVRPAEVTIDHVRVALDLLAGKSEGGVELDPLSCELSGIDFDRLMLLIRPSRRRVDDLSAGPKVPRKSAAKTAEPASSEDLRSDRRALVDSHIEAVLQQTGKRLTRTEIWKSAGYKSRVEFDRWQRNDPLATRTADRNFTRILKRERS
jgi:hypothetical protein